MNKTLLFSILFLSSLEVLERFLGIGHLPTPSLLALKFYDMTLHTPILLDHLTASLQRFLIGYLVAMIAGVVAGLILGLGGRIGAFLDPLISFMISIPTIAWVPIFLITFGLGDTTILAAIFLGGFFPIAYNTKRGLEMVDKNLLRAGQAMGVTRREEITSILIPASLPAILTGFRLGVGYCWRALIGAEMLAATEFGLGFMIYAARAFQDTIAMFLGITLIGLLSLTADKFILGYIEKSTIRRWGMITHHD